MTPKPIPRRAPSLEGYKAVTMHLPVPLLDRLTQLARGEGRSRADLIHLLLAECAAMYKPPVVSRLRGARAGK